MTVIRSKDGHETWVDVGLLPPAQRPVLAPVCGKCRGSLRLLDAEEGERGGARATMQCDDCKQVFVIIKEVA